MDERPRVGISACLLGDRVRYDGGDKRDASLLSELGPLVEWVRVCPEVDAGLGTPREPMQLVDVRGGIAMITIETRRDVTGRLTEGTRRRLDALEGEGLSGFVLKSRSPSCGLAVDVYEREAVMAKAEGVFARLLVERFPDLPIEDETRLADPSVRAAFLDRVFARHRTGADRTASRSGSR